MTTRGVRASKIQTFRTVSYTTSTGSAFNVSFYWSLRCLAYSGHTVVFLLNVWHFSHHDTFPVETIHPCVYLLHIQKHTHIKHILDDSKNIFLLLRFRVNIFSKSDFMIFHTSLLLTFTHHHHHHHHNIMSNGLFHSQNSFIWLSTFVFVFNHFSPTEVCTKKFFSVILILCYHLFRSWILSAISFILNSSLLSCDLCPKPLCPI
jgi:hypothetical protein